MTNTCSDCGANLALVGVRHRCVPAPRAGTVGVDRPIEKSVEVRSSARVSAQYKYRDPDKWRAYMADYMRRRRGLRGAA